MNSPELTALGFTDTYITRTQLASLHNGTTIFTSPDDAEEPRVLAYPADTVLSDMEKLSAEVYVRRKPEAIVLNNTATTGPAGYPADGVALTKADIGALHDGNVMFATPSDSPGNFRFIVYPDGTVLTADQKATMNAYTRNA